MASPCRYCECSNSPIAPFNYLIVIIDQTSHHQRDHPTSVSDDYPGFPAAGVNVGVQLNSIFVIDQTTLQVSSPPAFASEVASSPFIDQNILQVSPPVFALEVAPPAPPEDNSLSPYYGIAYKANDLQSRMHVPSESADGSAASLAEYVQSVGYLCYLFSAFVDLQSRTCIHQ